MNRNYDMNVFINTFDFDKTIFHKLSLDKNCSHIYRDNKYNNCKVYHNEKIIMNIFVLKIFMKKYYI